MPGRDGRFTGLDFSSSGESELSAVREIRLLSEDSNSPFVNKILNADIVLAETNDH